MNIKFHDVIKFGKQNGITWEADTVQISQSSYDLIKERFNCVARGVAQVKGKGEMHIWAVEN